MSNVQKKLHSCELLCTQKCIAMKTEGFPILLCLHFYWKLFADHQCQNMRRMQVTQSERRSKKPETNKKNYDISVSTDWCRDQSNGNLQFALARIQLAALVTFHKWREKRTKFSSKTCLSNLISLPFTCLPSKVETVVLVDASFWKMPVIFLVFETWKNHKPTRNA